MTNRDENALDVICSDNIVNIRDYEAPSIFLNSWLRCQECNSLYRIQEDCKCQKPKRFEMRWKNYGRE